MKRQPQTTNHFVFQYNPIESVKSLCKGTLQVTAFLLLALFIVCPAKNSYADDNQKVLILNSYHQGYNWTDALVSGILDTLKSELPNLNPLIEYMDTKRLKSSEYQETYFRLLSMKYAKNPPELVIASDDNAFHFLRKYRTSLFPQTPVVFMGVNHFTPSMLKGHEDKITGVIQHADIAATIEAALKLHPKARGVAVIAGDSATGRGYKKQTKAVQPLFKGIEFEYLDGANLTTGELIARLKNLPPDYIGLLCTWVRDRSGTYTRWEVGYPKLSAACKVPLYGVIDDMLNYGALGGKVQSGRTHGIAAARLALRIIKGEPPSAIPVRMKSPNQFMFDYTQMKRWGLTRNALPEGSTVINEPQSFYYLYKERIWAVVAVFITMALAIAALTWNTLLRRKAEQELRFSEEKYRGIFDNALEGIFQSTPEGKLLQANTSMAHTLGFESSEELLAANMNMKNDVYSTPSERDMLLKRLLQEEKVWNFETQFKRKGGNTRWVSLNVRGIKNMKGKLERIEGLISDISHRKQMELQLKNRNEALEAINRELDEFAFIASHDLREPLRGIINYSTFLLEDYGNVLDEEGKDKLSTLIKLSRREEKQVDALLKYSRLGQADLNIEAVDLNEITTDVAELLYAAFPDEEIDVRVPTPLPTLYCDKIRVREVFLNLITNAIKYNENKLKVIEIQSKYEPGRPPILTVKDNGIGIPPKHLERIFSIFKRLHPRDKFGGGIGAGLSIVRKIIERHGGQIWVNSTPGEETTFYFTLEEEKHDD